jgi:CBS domain-containing protein
MTTLTQRSYSAMLRNTAAKIKVSNLIARKRQGVWTVAADASVYEAIHAMAEHSVGALPVTDAGRIVGIISERDYARKLILSGRSSLTTQVRDVMTTELITVTEQSTIEECMALMTQHKIRHLPVLYEGALLGIVSIGDLVYEIMTQQQHALDELERYIAG